VFGEKWIPLYEASTSLAKVWDIAPAIVEEIIRAVLVDGVVSARGHYRNEIVPRMIPKECWSTLPPGFLPNSWRGWTDIEIDSIGLQKHGRNHLPSGWTLPLEADCPPNPEEDDNLRGAPESEIKKAIKAVYDQAERERKKPPNLKEISNPVLEILRNEGFKTSKAQIQTLAGHPDFKKRRRKPGPTLSHS
jgi:hypothetical protein